MKMQPPALINKQVTEDMLHWFMVQPSTIVVPKSCIGKTGLIKSGSFSIEQPKPFAIDDRTKDFMLFELQKILEFNGFSSELLDNGSLKVSKDYWEMDIESIRNQLPFPDYLPHQINKCYENYEYESNEVKRDHTDYPSRERLESIRQTIIDNTEGDL